MKERRSCSEVFYKKGALRKFEKNFKSTFCQRIPLVAASERVNESLPPFFCSCWKGKYW